MILPFLDQPVLYISERRRLSLIPENTEHFGEFPDGIRVHSCIRNVSCKVLIWARIRVTLFHVYPARRHTVAKHLCHIFDWHAVSRIDYLSVVGKLPVNPVFKMMAVSPLVVEPKDLALKRLQEFLPEIILVETCITN